MADISRMTWFVSIRMLLRHFLRKAGACTVRHGTAFSGVKAIYRPIASASHPLALSQLGARARDVMVIDKLVISAELDDMAAVGIRGVRLN